MGPKIGEAQLYRVVCTSPGTALPTFISRVYHKSLFLSRCRKVVFVVSNFPTLFLALSHFMDAPFPLCFMFYCVWCIYKVEMQNGG
jgi:hypothetical protein